jgi:hypothetical protein
MNDATILYYSSNREPWLFEKRIIHTLLKNSGGLPIVSVTQKPINLGKNICVGDVGTSGFNMFRQILIGLYEIPTTYVISAEADCIYPPDYFQFEPERDDVLYRNTNLYVLGLYKNSYRFKPQGSSWSQVVGREHYIKRLEKLFAGAPEWCVEEKSFPKERWKKEDVWDTPQLYTTENPCISFKTGRGMRKTSPAQNTPIESVAYWGSGRELRRKYLTDIS